MSSIWNTQKSTTENKSVWGSIRQEPQQQVVNPNASVFETQHVMKAMPVFSTILADHVEFNKYLKQVILCLLYTSPSPRDRQKSRMPSSA